MFELDGIIIVTNNAKVVIIHSFNDYGTLEINEQQRIE